MLRVRSSYLCMAIVAVIAMVGQTVSATTIVLDPFNDDLGTFVDGESNENVKMGDVPGIPILKLVDGPDTPTVTNELIGTRTATLSVTPGAMGMPDGRIVLVQTAFNIGLQSDALSITTDENHAAMVVVDYAGIAGVDLTDGGTNDGFLAFVSSDPSATGTSFKVTLTDDSAVDYVGTFPSFTHPAPYVFIPFEDFAPMYTGALVENINIMITTPDGGDLAIDLVAFGDEPIVPEPMTATLGLMGLGVLVARRRHRAA